MKKILFLIGLCVAGLFVGCDPWGGCFPAGTNIKTPTGNAAIESIKVGDVVYAFDQKTYALIETKVSRVYEKDVSSHYNVKLASGFEVRATGEHPFYSPATKTFKDLSTFTVGENLWVYVGGGWKTDPITKLEYRAGSVKVYNIEVADANHTFIAENMAVHNKSPLPIQVEVSFSLNPGASSGTVRVDAKYSSDPDVIVATNSVVPFEKYRARQIEAIPAAGKTFLSWSGDVTSTENPLTIRPEGNMSITANFSP